MDEFIWRALAGGLGVALIAGPFGCFIVWRRMAYFGDTLAHSALLGVTLGYLLDLDLNLGIVATSLAVAVLLVTAGRSQTLGTDTLLGIVSHSALALGIVLTTFVPDLRVDLMSFLFGDILAVTRTDLLWIWGGGALAGLALLALWRPLLALTVHAELAEVEGVPVTQVRIAFMLLLAIAVSLALKVVGIVLVTSLLIIPAAAARRLAGSPEQMALAGAALGCVAVAGGLGASLIWDTPTGPSVVVTASLLFLLSRLAPARLSLSR
ncbi:MAG: metal ABC transporter permease [Alphaproteobacteria bacterium]|nr:metal ABC transporter permease [Alphaproteobacteria bacterium]